MYSIRFVIRFFVGVEGAGISRLPFKQEFAGSIPVADTKCSGDVDKR